MEPVLSQLVRVALALTVSSVDPRPARSEEIDLSSPASTVLSYCNSDDLETIRSCFESGTPLEEGIARRIWSSCRIVEVRPARVNGGSAQAQDGDVEVVTEVRMIDSAKGNPLTRFWYLLREHHGRWKIVSNSHIADEHYPPLE